MLCGPMHLNETLVMLFFSFSYRLHYPTICCYSNRYFAYSVNIMWLQNAIRNYFTTAGFASIKPHLSAASRSAVRFFFQKLN